MRVYHQAWISSILWLPQTALTTRKSLEVEGECMAVFAGDRARRANEECKQQNRYTQFASCCF